MSSVGVPLMLTIRFPTAREGIDSRTQPGAAPIGRWAGLKHLERRCTARKKNRDRCKNPARFGTNVCDVRGANAPQVKRKGARGTGWPGSARG